MICRFVPVPALPKDPCAEFSMRKINEEWRQLEYDLLYKAWEEVGHVSILILDSFPQRLKLFPV
jgi:hypothetical protein